MNRIILFGHLGHSPEPRTRSRSAYFHLAVNEPYWNAAGEKVERVAWFQIVAWNDLADRVMKYLHHGDEALVEGRVELREFEGRDGTKKAMLRVTAFRIEFGAKARPRDEPAETPAPAAVPDEPEFGVVPDDGNDGAVDDDDLPF